MLHWRGKQVNKRVETAARTGLNLTGVACVFIAQQVAPRDTGFMANTIEFEPAKQEGNELVVYWGNWTANYTLWQEIGSNGRPGRYFLRQARDAEYPKLAGRIRRAYK